MKKLLVVLLLLATPAFAQRSSQWGSSKANMALSKTLTDSGDPGLDKLAADPTCTTAMEGRVWQNTTTDLVKACLNGAVATVGPTAAFTGGTLTSPLAANQVTVTGTATFSAQTFFGSGLNDATYSTTWTSASTVALPLAVKICATGTPDSICEVNQGGGGLCTCAPLVGAAGTPQVLGSGQTITFAAHTGHTNNARWEITATPVTPIFSAKAGDGYGLTVDGEGVVTSYWGFVGSLTGNASTATALAANPADCSAGQYATTIAANGNLTCSTPPGGIAASAASDCSGGTCTCTFTTSNLVCLVTVRNGSNAITLSGHVGASTIGKYTVITTGGGASKTITWAAAAGSVKWPSAVTPVATASANQDIFVFVDDGTNYLGASALNY